MLCAETQTAMTLVFGTATEALAANLGGLCCIERSLAILAEDLPAGDASRPFRAAFSASGAHR
jgi:hypothetical protein